MKDLILATRIMDKVFDENTRQIEKWGVQDHNETEWLAITAEEFGEMSKAIVDYHFALGSPSLVVKEAIQTATLCLKIAEMFSAEREWGYK